MTKIRKDMSGMTFESWAVLSFSKVIDLKQYWLCRCICGTIKEVEGYKLRTGKSKSCGCRRQFFKDKDGKYTYVLGDKFWLHVVKTDSCWIWDGVKNSQGYGKLHVNSKSIGAHRYSYTLHKGNIPKGSLIRHSCDTPSCVNPEHLSLGSHADNKRDSILKLRHAHHESHGNAVINTEHAMKIKDMLKNGYSSLKISEGLNIAKHIVVDIKRGRTWASL